jgi:hypothetical protein
MSDVNSSSVTSRVGKLNIPANISGLSVLGGAKATSSPPLRPPILPNTTNSSSSPPPIIKPLSVPADAHNNNNNNNSNGLNHAFSSTNSNAAPLSQYPPGHPLAPKSPPHPNIPTKTASSSYSSGPTSPTMGQRFAQQPLVPNAVSFLPPNSPKGNSGANSAPLALTSSILSTGQYKCGTCDLSNSHYNQRCDRCGAANPYYNPQNPAQNTSISSPSAGNSAPINMTDQLKALKELQAKQRSEAAALKAQKEADAAAAKAAEEKKRVEDEAAAAVAAAIAKEEAEKAAIRAAIEAEAKGKADAEAQAIAEAQAALDFANNGGIFSGNDPSFASSTVPQGETDGDYEHESTSGHRRDSTTADNSSISRKAVPIVVIMEGPLNKRSSTGFRLYSARYCVLYNDFFTYAKKKGDAETRIALGAIKFAHIMHDKKRDKVNKFDIVTGDARGNEKTFSFEAKSVEEADRWINHIHNQQKRFMENLNKADEDEENEEEKEENEENNSRKGVKQAVQAAPSARPVSKFSFQPASAEIVDLGVEILAILNSEAIGEICLVRDKDHSSAQRYLLHVIHRSDNEFQRSEQLFQAQATLRGNHYFLKQLLWGQTTDSAFSLYTPPIRPVDSLYNWLQIHQIFPEIVVKHVASELCYCLGYLHEKNLTFPNLSPEYLYFSASGNLLCADFLLPLAANSLPLESLLPEYIAPELLAQDIDNPRADWWKLGILLYEMAVGYPPINISISSTNKTQEIYEKIKQFSPSQLQFPSFVSTELADLIQLLLIPEPAQRLGAIDDWQSVKQHKFFSGVNFDHISQGNNDIIPPWITENVISAKNRAAPGLIIPSSCKEFYSAGIPGFTTGNFPSQALQLYNSGANLLLSTPFSQLFRGSSTDSSASAAEINNLFRRTAAVPQFEADLGSDAESDGEEKSIQPKLKQTKRLQRDEFDLDMSVVTENLIVMSYPADISPSAFSTRNCISTVQQFLSRYYDDNYKVYNLQAEKLYPPAKFNNSVANQYSIAELSAPSLPCLLGFCADLYSYLSAQGNVAVIHCKTGKNRSGCFISCYLLYAGIVNSAEEAVNFFAKKRTNNSSALLVPSQRRYVQYFANFLHKHRNYSSELPLAGPPILKNLLLNHIRLTPVPNITHNGCNPYVVVKTTMNSANPLVLFNSKHSTNTAAANSMHDRNFCDIFLSNCTVAGDFAVYVYEYSTDSLLFSVFLHTNFIDHEYISLHKSELDVANRDKSNKKFAAEFKCELFFERNS